MFNHHFHLLNFTINRELSEIYLCVFIRSLALSMIDIFIPIYFLKELSYSLQDIFFFFIILYLAFGAFSPLIAKLSARLGFKHMILFSAPFLIVYYLLLYLLPVYAIPLQYIALICGIAHASFWVAFHTEFAVSSTKKHRGEQVGVWFALSTLISALAPFIGGVIITFFSFHVLFITVSLLLVASAIPLFFSREIYKKTPFDWSNIFRKKYLKDGISYTIYGARAMISGLCWVLFIFLILKQYLSLGTVASASSIFMVFFIYLIGRYSDKLKKSSLIQLGCLGSSLIWIIRLFVKDILQIFGVSILGDIAWSLIDVPYTARVYNKAIKSKSLVEYFVFREIALSLGRILVLVALLLLSFKLSFTVLAVSFIIAAILNLLQMFFSKL